MSAEKELALVVRGTDWSETSRIATLFALVFKHFSQACPVKGTESRRRKHPAMARSSKGPWFRQAKNAWFVKASGRQVSLGVKGLENEKEAIRAWHRLMAGEPAQKPQEATKLTSKAVEPAAKIVTVGEVVDGFLADVADRAKPKTVKVYR